VLNLNIVVGSTREGRAADQVIPWLTRRAEQREVFTTEIVDLREWALPMFSETVHTVGDFSNPTYSQPLVREWNDKMRSADAFVFVTPEYNHSTSGVLKNAIDFLQAEWNNKAAALVGYGGVGGARAVEHLRGVLSEVQVAHVRQTLAFSFFTDFENLSDFKPAAMHAASAAIMFDQLEGWASALRPIRERSQAAA
jgi:NAD(P)H-dependent FMN reductase